MNEYPELAGDSAKDFIKKEFHPLFKKSDAVEASMVEDVREEGSNGMEV